MSTGTGPEARLHLLSQSIGTKLQSIGTKLQSMATDKNKHFSKMQTMIGQLKKRLTCYLWQMVGVSQDLCIESLQADDGHGKELRQEESLVKLLGSDLWALPHQDLVFEHLLDFHICVIASQLVSKEDEERRYFVSTQYLGKLLLLLQHLLLGVIISQLVLKRNEDIKCHFHN